MYLRKDKIFTKSPANSRKKLIQLISKDYLGIDNYTGINLHHGQLSETLQKLQLIESTMMQRIDSLVKGCSMI